MLADVQGQEDGVRFLRCFVEGKLTSPLLLVGEVGVGRRFSVLQAVKEVFCVGDRESDCTCGSCLHVEQGTHSDLTVLVPEEEGKDIGIAAIRELLELASSYPFEAPWRCIVIDGADHLTIPAANALLKTLEDPPARTVFFLLAEDYDKVLPTIQSRCGKLPYRTLPEGLVLSKLQEFEADSAKALVYARMGEGSIGRAIHYWGSGQLGLRDRVYTLLQLGLKGDIAASFSAVDSISQELSLGLRLMDQLLYDILMIQQDPTRLINQDITEGIEELRQGASLETWVELAAGVGAMRDHWANINEPFHLKSLLSRTLLS